MDAALIQYMAELMPAAAGIQCSGCPGEVSASDMVIRNDRVFCSEICADMHFAPMPRISPKGAEVEGWAI